jgi:hypothetical protein
MANFIVVNNFQFGGAIRVRDNFLEVPDHRVIEEVELGKHEENEDKWMSGLLNHCSPADQHTKDLIAGKAKPLLSAAEEIEAKQEEEKQAEIKRLRGEFDKLGKAYNPRWAIDKLQKELVVARRSAPVNGTGAGKDAKPKKEVIK